METKSVQDIVDLTENESTLKSPQRKLKQAQLPFHILDTKPGDGQNQSKKRKISGSASEGRIQKTPKQEDDENQKSPVTKTQAKDMKTPVSKSTKKNQKLKKCLSGKSLKNCSPNSERENNPENNSKCGSPKDNPDQVCQPKSKELGGSPKTESSKIKTKNILQKFLKSSPSDRYTNNSDEIIIESDHPFKDKDSTTDDNETSGINDKSEVEVESKAHKDEEKLKIKFTWETNCESNQSKGNKDKTNLKITIDATPQSKEVKSNAANTSPINVSKMSPSPSIKDLLTKNLKRTPQDNLSENENCVSRSTENKDCCSSKTSCEDNDKGNLEVVIIDNMSENIEEVVRAAAAEVSSDGFDLSGKFQPVKENSASQSGSSTPHSTIKKQSAADTPDTSNSPSMDNNQCSNKTPTIKKKMTPKQLEKYQALEKNRELREKEKKEREKKKAEEKAERERIKKEKQEKKEREKQEKEKQKQVELEAKEEEKRKKDEEKKKKEEAKLLEKQKKEETRLLEKQKKEEAKLLEKQKKEEEKKQKEEEKKKIEEEAEKKKNREKAAFASFFVPKKTLTECNGSPVHAFMPFVIKVDMRLAPCVRSTLTPEMYEVMDNSIQKQTATALYLSELKAKNIVSRRSGKTWPIEERKDDPDIEIIDDDDDDEELPEGKENIILETHDTKQPRVKLLSFQENRRPPYWGTWQKISNKILPRRPFSKDEHFFDYEVDSDDEWEEEGEGDSLSNSEDEKEPEDDYEVDNEFFVPHGYLSEEEANDEDEMPSPETHKAKLKLKEQEFEEELKKKTHKIKPRLIGCLWVGDKNNNAAYDQLMKILHPYEAVFCTSCAASPIPTTLSIPPQKGQVSPDVASTPASYATQTGSTAVRQKGFKRKKIAGDTHTLVELVHGSTKKKPFLARELLSYWKQKYEVASSDGGKVTDAAQSPDSSHVK